MRRSGLTIFVPALRRLTTVPAICTVWAAFQFLPPEQLTAAQRQIDLGYSHQTAYLSADEHLTRLQGFFHPTLEACRMEFPGQAGIVRGFGAGSSYPNVWVRDAATHIPITRYYYPLEYLTSWLEEHLSHQAADGGLYDWIALGAPSLYLRNAPKVKELYRTVNPNTGRSVVLSADKNTMMSDQEAHAVDAAHQILKITGDRTWARRMINGKALVERLDASLRYILENKLHPRYGLVTSGFSADWGDVTPIYPDQRAIYLDDKTPVVVALYHNSIFYRAAGQLAEIREMLGDKSRASYWRQKAGMLKRNINKHLWQEQKGFYRTHLVVTPDLTRGWPDDQDMFGMGSNALTALYGIANDRQARRIFDVAEQRRRKFGISTIAGVLLPPYPNGFFSHRILTEEYTYLNGGQWDWFAARLLLAEFERGHSRRAYRQLVEIAAKSVTNQGLHEWHTKDGKGRGSANYAGNAGALSGAIVQGLFGIYLSADALLVNIRLGDKPGQIHLYQPATDTYVAYHYGYDEGAGRITVNYEANVSPAGRVGILLPKNRRAARLLLDGKELVVVTKRIGEDTYVECSTDWKPHRVELTLR